ncbi:hypothetical protein GQ43DRAFT_387274 [Delitschia confertaspora ATCC 74209]|uniref:Shugoshin C-terminal domain-containing protein n=1 Tax=Delitschia confertaspora ATCC 74209 TaxID=1513339 RepID=A0A9P4MZ05_9PLEO|nr:hypothetical protein GQ43DRAFT_387274 [Delitschia confertaspora ATCC 74209]
MARLNDPPVAPGPSTESVDAVKRRFLRQNRELAKTNSQQSVRIRNLETEGARLLAENLSLREQVINLQNALETQSTRPSLENINTVKDKLEAKIQELGSLVAELGQIRRPKARRESRIQTATRPSPEERQWRSGLCLQEVENAMLPTIAEGKHFPRKTMNADELREMLDAPDSQSPDLGPPPVSRFENEGPIKFDSEPMLVEEPLDEEAEDANPDLSVNLETRKKRRESAPKLKIRRISVFQSPPENSDERTENSIRAGAKRKLSAREEEEKPKVDNTEGDGFIFSRVNPPIDPEKEVSPFEEGSDRPVLGSKPVNTDPVLSPKKQRSSTLSKPDKKPSKPSRSRNAETRRAVIDTIQIPPEPIQTADIHLNSLPPKTPAAEGTFSPPSTQPSTSRPESKDTPPPTDLNPSNPANPTDGVARPSRRARAQVNYAEPNLVSKMRRPTKELAPAVLPPSASKSANTESAPSTASKLNGVIKHEREEGPDSAWKDLPTGPGAEDGGSPLKEKLERKHPGETARIAPPTGLTLNSSAAAEAISALISGSSSSRRKSATPKDTSATASTSAVISRPLPSRSDSAPDLRKDDKPSTAIKEANNLAIFDFNESSPPDPAPSTSRSRTDLAKARQARRHSSISSTDTKSKESNGTLPSLHSKSENVGKTGSADLSKKGEDEGKGTGTSRSRSTFKERERKRDAAAATAAVKEGKESADIAAAAVADPTSRADRAASRRKSMML